MGKWWILIKERFSPSSYLPMIVVFTAANGLYVCQASQSEWNWLRFAMSLLLMTSFFFRMRLFDEIKDYDVDLKVNPTRPLARGVIKIVEVKKALLVLIIFELILASILGANSFIIHAIAIGFSLLMYEEFFIGDFLRPHLTTYALTHTFSSFLLALSTGIAMSGVAVTELPISVFVFLSMNWAFFNLFEFARKTFAKSEERDHVASYSNIFGRGGAWILSISQAALGVAIVLKFKWNILILAAFIVYLAISTFYLIQGSEKSAKIFRNCSGVYLLIHYVILLYVLGM